MFDGRQARKLDAARQILGASQSAITTFCSDESRDAALYYRSSLRLERERWP